MSPDEICYLSARSMAELVRQGELSASELLTIHLDRVATRDGELNAIVALEADRARREAEAVDANSGEIAPLRGVPITVKDSFMIEGGTTTSGAPEYADFTADHDAAAVAALRSAGAIPYGKSNLPIYAGDVQSFNDVFGTTNNPWDLGRSPGGSSGGSAASLAAGFTPLEIGSDIAGSIRNPAAACGVVGHKPSYGIVSGRGQIPGPPGTLTQADIAVVGPMARTVDDCSLALELMVAPDPWMEKAWTVSLPPPRTQEPSSLRVAVWATDDYCAVDPEIEQAIRRVAGDLESAGARVDHEARPDGFDFAKADRTFDQLLGAALSGGWPAAELEEMAAREAQGEVVGGELGIAGATLRHRGWLSANERRLQMRARWADFFRNWDVLLAPISPTVAIPHDHSHPMSDRTIMVAGEQRPYTSQMQWMGLFGVVWLPATAVPIGLHSDGLPMALQVVGPYLEDNTCLAAASLIEGLDGCGFQRPPGW